MHAYTGQDIQPEHSHKQYIMWLDTEKCNVIEIMVTHHSITFLTLQAIIHPQVLLVPAGRPPNWKIPCSWTNPRMCILLIRLLQDHKIIIHWCNSVYRGERGGGHPWYSGSALGCWSTGRAVDLAPVAWFIIQFISLAQVVPGPV